MRTMSSQTSGQIFATISADDADDLPRQIYVRPGNTLALLLIPDPILRNVEFDMSKIPADNKILRMELLYAGTLQAGLLCTADQVGELEITAEFKQPLSQYGWTRSVALKIIVA